MKTLVYLLFVLAASSLAACQPKPAPGEIVSVTGGSDRSIPANDLNSMLKNKDFMLINVHIPLAGNIAGTDRSIPYDQIGQNLALLPGDKNARIVLYCRSGRMSAIAAEALVKLGYTDVWDLKGGTAAWEQAGLTLENK
jgi:rhodanese-related sulfurtransferase